VQRSQWRQYKLSKADIEAKPAKVHLGKNQINYNPTSVQQQGLTQVMEAKKLICNLIAMQ
jgi:hypothetical protein